jgi:hypothetical protein
MLKLSCDQLVKDLDRQVKISAGIIPTNRPNDMTGVKMVRIFVNIVRQAEHDYLSPQSSPEMKFEAARTLFGIHLSPLSSTCLALGIDPHAAKLKLIEWEIRGLTGDPIFGYLSKPGSVDRYERGDKLDIPTFDAEIDNGPEDTKRGGVRRIS